MRRSLGALGATAALLAVAAGGGTASAGPARDAEHAPARHVILISVDGLHDSDLNWWTRDHPASNLARIVRGGTHYRNASTPIISDSFPGLVGQITGGDPRTTGVYYDDSWNRALLPGGAPCTPGQTTGLGAEVFYHEGLAFNMNSIDSGLGIAGLYAGGAGTISSGIFSLPGDAATIDRKIINAANLPLDPATCKPVYPHAYLRVNTVFEVAHAAGIRTAWSDKHAAYEVVNGPSGTGVDDLFAPEINSSTTDPAVSVSADWTKNNRNTQTYDAVKVQAVVNEIDGFDHTGVTRAAVPAILGMNFQSVSTAQKLPRSPIDGVTQPGGYQLVNGRWIPGPVLTDALSFVDQQVGRIVAELNARHLMASTTLVISAKHGQSPIDASSLKRINDGAIIDALNAAWVAAGNAGDLVAFSVDDDAMLLWLNDRSTKAVTFARTFLMGFNLDASAKKATDYAGNAIGFTSSGLARVQDGPSLIGVSASDSRVPDLVGVVQHGVVYTGGKAKISEHGGSDAQDRHVPIVVFGAGAERGEVVRRHVATTQIAPTILTLLGLDPNALQAVRLQGTRALPGLG